MSFFVLAEKITGAEKTYIYMIYISEIAMFLKTGVGIYIQGSKLRPKETVVLRQWKIRFNKEESIRVKLPPLEDKL